MGFYITSRVEVDREHIQFGEASEVPQLFRDRASGVQPVYLPASSNKLTRIFRMFIFSS
jgi:hypothetical protein